MEHWVIAEWAGDEGPIRAPSFQGAGGKWYRAGISEYGGPTIMLMDSEPTEITQIQGASPQRRSASCDLHGVLVNLQTRQAAIGDRVTNLAAMVASSLNRIERELSRLTSRPVPPPHKLGGNSGDMWFGPPVTQPVLPQAPAYQGPVAPTTYMSGGLGGCAGGGLVAITHKGAAGAVSTTGTAASEPPVKD